MRRWRDWLRGADLGELDSDLSAEGAAEALRASLDALDDHSLDLVAALGLRPFPTATVVAASTVLTAPVEWCAVLLGRGTAVTLKHSEGAPGLAPLLARAAAEVGLPLGITEERDAVLSADLVVAMGSDATIEEIRRRLPASTRLLPHGHRFSAAWIRGAPLPLDDRVPNGFRDPWGGVAADAALHDGRGCLSPSLVLSPEPLDRAAERLAAAMDLAARRWPTGRIAPAEAARIRSRRALATVTGVVREGAGWSVHGLPPEQLRPQALPRSVVVCSVPDPAAAAALLGPWRRSLSTLATDEDHPALSACGATRLCRPGRMQRPPLLRSHDGEDWLRATGISVSCEI